MEKYKLSFEDFFGALTVYMIARDYNYNIKLNISRLIRNRMEGKVYSDGTVVGTVLFPYQFSCWSNTENRAELVNSFIEGILNANESVYTSIKSWNESLTNKGNNLILGYKNTDTEDVCQSIKSIVVENIPPFIFYK